MSESVDVLIQADDQASETLRKTSDEFLRAQKRGEAIFKSTQTASEKLSAELKTLRELHMQGAIATDKYRQAKERLQQKMDELTSGAKSEAAAIRDVAEETEKAGVSFKEAAGQTKASTELFGTLATTLGGTELGGVASQLGSLTEKMSAFSEVSKAGGAGALAFKAGLVAAVGVIAFQVGNALGNIIFQTEKWNRELELARENFQRLSAAGAAMQQQQFSFELQDIELIQNPDEKKAKVQELLATIDQNIAGVSARVRKTTEDIEKLDASWFKSGNTKAQLENDKLANEEDKQRLETMKQQRQQLEMLISGRKEENDAIIAANAAAEKRKASQQASLDYLKALRSEIDYMNASREDQLRMEAERSIDTQGLTGEDKARAMQQVDEAVNLLKERDAIEAKKKSEEEYRRQVEQRAKEEQSAHEKKLQQDRSAIEKQLSLIQGIKQQTIALAEGEQAAKAYGLQLQGIDKDTASSLADIEAGIKSLSAKTKEAGELKATESRLLSSGGQRIDPVADNTKQIVVLTQKANELLQAATERLASLDSKSQRTITIQEVGA